MRLITWRTGSKFWQIIHEQNSVISKTDLSLLIISILINVPVHYIQKSPNKIPRNISDDYLPSITSRKFLSDYIIDFRLMASEIAEAEPQNLYGNYNTLIFEGAQGLLLSQDFGENEKHTTPSYTGAENPVRIIGMLSGKNDVEVCYVTRTYLTRHGAGPFEGECPKNEINPHMTDMTNVPNGYQGTLRYGRLDVKSLRERINADFAKFGSVPNAEMSLAVTHLNETNGKIVTPIGDVLPESFKVNKLYYSYDEYGDIVYTI